ncbi:MAG: suppressor of fused domain protein [Crocinitomicaceae bacterium]|nr:suppressor of fused domain protein [Crocinitomicaceae bacterium]
MASEIRTDAKINLSFANWSTKLLTYLCVVVTERLQSVFEFAEVAVVHKNAEFDFAIKLIKPKGEKFQILYTEGLSKNIQIGGQSNKKYQRIELYFLLPDFWDLAKKEWPVFWLNKIAQVPQKNKTWFGVGDTLPAGNPPKEVDEVLKCTYFILSDPMLLDSKLSSDLEAEEAFSFLAVIPIFEREFDFKMQNSATPLLKIFKDKQIFEMIDTYREPVARKKFMGIF